MQLGQQFNNVFDFAASKKVKAATGQGRAIRSTTPESAELEKRANQAIELNKPVEKKKSAYDKALEFLGLNE